MKYLPLVLAGLWRKPARTIFTFLSVVVAFILFGIMASIESGFAKQVAVARLDRLYVDTRFGGNMPIAYQNKIAAIPGVTIVEPVVSLNGYWKDPKNPAGVTMADEHYVEARPEYHLTHEQMRSLDRSRTGVIVSKTFAKRYNWKIGERFALTSPTPQTDGSKAWTFEVAAITDNYDFPDAALFMLGSYKYFDEARVTEKGMVQRFLVRIANPDRSAEIGRTIDNLFANSPQPTRTLSEKANAQAATASIGDITFFTRSIIGAVLFMLLFLTGNTLMQSVRERTPEFAVLKTIGFSDRGVLGLVLAESVILCILAGLAGLCFDKFVVPVLIGLLPSNSGNAGALLMMPWSAAATGMAFALLMAGIAGFFPALRVKRLNVVDALAGR
jgi:putative ABC transport system permease protein